jgi:mannose-1-phosphate guanylyltransferase
LFVKGEEIVITPVIIAGGSGTRLWPLSRALQPKQFLNLLGDATMLQQTLLRLTDIEHESPITICNEEHRFLVAEQLREIDQLGQIILEPIGRNTAPAIALAAYAALQNKPDNDPLLLVLPADHLIRNEAGLSEAVSNAIPLAMDGKLVTFGVKPLSPHTGYGYIKKGSAIGDGFAIDQFVEKPDMETARIYVSDESYLWNSGMFLFKASVYLEELVQHSSEINAVCKQAMSNSVSDLDFLRIELEDFERCTSDSIDYAVMEKTDEAVVVPLNAEWSDIGSWASLWENSDKDNNKNVMKGRVLLEESQNCLVFGEGRLIAGVGLNDMIIVDTKDALLVATKDKSEQVKAIVDRLKQQDSPEYKLNREVLRPWGKFDSVDNGERYQVKRITVKPGEKLSLQMHHHRAEHWIVVSGTAMVHRGEDLFLVTENESTFIPLGVKHSLENPGKLPLEIIEVQSGSYLGEDDIVRFDDRYGRTGSTK